MTNTELENELGRLIKTERKITNDILRLINLAEKRQLYIERGYASLFDWLTRAYNYSSPAAHRRIQAARLLRDVPEIAQKIESGDVNLTTLSKTQSLIRWQEKKSGGPISPETKSNIVEKIENKSTIEAERTLYKLFPDLAKEASFERATVISDSVTKLSLSMSYESLRNLERVRALLSHKLPQGSLTDVIVFLVNNFLEKKDPLQQKDKVPKSLNATTNHQRSKIQSAVRNVVIKRAHGKCEYTDPTTGRKCESSYQLEIDHIYPVAFGGQNNLENLRCLCSKHNRFVAQEIFNLPLPS